MTHTFKLAKIAGVLVAVSLLVQLLLAPLLTNSINAGDSRSSERRW